VSRLDSRRAKLARRAITKLRRTIVPDLLTMRKWAAAFDAHPQDTAGLGALNFALMMVALVGCEALGYWTMGAAAHQRAKSPESADVGCYIMDVVERFFPAGSQFRRVSKVLADYVRHDLVHGFGVRPSKSRFEVALNVRPESGSAVRFRRDGRRQVLVLDSVAFAGDLIAAFDEVLRRFKKDTEMVKQCTSAAAYRTPKMSAKVRNQFIEARDFILRHA
jgi:hypothetical protein